MKKNHKFLVIILLLSIITIFTFLKTPTELQMKMHSVAVEEKSLALIMHGIFLILFILGLLIKKFKTIFFSSLLIILSGTALVISFIYLVIPNIFVFGTFFILTISAILKKDLHFNVSHIGTLGKIIGYLSIITGFYYLHWVESPILINALLYSPLGIVNCPTLVTFSGLLIFADKKGPRLLEIFVGIITLYFGFFGIMRLNVFVDITLVLSGAYLLVTQASYLDSQIFYKKENITK